MENEAIQILRPSMSTSAGRWAAFGPYYAMFPVEFAMSVINRYSRPGEKVLDPFAGRGTSVFSAAYLQRVALGIEINPVGWLFGSVKLSPAPLQSTLKRLIAVSEASEHYIQESQMLPEFYHWCFGQKVRKFLVAARALLDWRNNQTDATLMATILVYLHGKLGQSLSNQMRQTKSMSPDYSIRWWSARNLTPPELDPVEFLKSRLEWRYSKGAPNYSTSKMLLGDSREVLLSQDVRNYGRFNLLFTSPPYYGVTNYYYDQWLRIWMLGGPELPTYQGDYWKTRFGNKLLYRELLESVFSLSAKYLTEDAVIYVRTDAREYTLNTTLEVLKVVFPKKSIIQKPVPVTKKTQTALFGDFKQKPGEVDIILQGS